MVTQATGTVAFLFSDMEGSTSLLQRLGRAVYADVLAEQRRIMRAAIEATGGRELGTEGDSFAVSFPSATDALRCAVQAQAGIAATRWPAEVAVRMGIHVGEVTLLGDGYIGLPVHEAARVAAAAWGGQVLLSAQAAALADVPPGATLTELGTYELRDVGRRTLVQLHHPQLRDGFPPPRSVGAMARILPHAPTPLIGRDDEIDEVSRLVGDSSVVTLVGPGGVGKTRLAMAAGAALDRSVADLAVWVDLADVTDDDEPSVAAAVVRSLDPAPSDEEPTERLVDLASAQRTLFLFDNCEHVLASATHVTRGLLESTGTTRVLATSRARLGLRSERVFVVPGLDVPPAGTTIDGATVARHSALRLFVERALAARGEELADDDLEVVAEICRRVAGLPLAIELAAARTAAFQPDEILQRLERSLRFLRSDDATVSARQATLEATVAWSWDLLRPAEQTVLRRLACFEAPARLDAAERVCATGDVEDWEVADHLATLARHSLATPVEVDGTTHFDLHALVRRYASAQVTDDERHECRVLLLDWARAWAGAHGGDRHVRADHAMTDRYAADLLRSLASAADDGDASAVDTAWELRGWLPRRADGVHLLERAAALAGDDPRAPLLRAAALDNEWVAPDDFDRMIEVLEEAADAAATLGLRAERLRAATLAQMYRQDLSGEPDAQRKDLAELVDDAMDDDAVDDAEWARAASYLIRLAGVPEPLRRRIRSRLVATSRTHREPLRCGAAYAALGMATDGDLDEARDVLDEALGYVPGDRVHDRGVLHIVRAGLELLHLDPTAARPHLEELAMLPLRDDDLRSVDALARAALAVMDDRAAEVPRSFPSTYLTWAIAGWLLDRLVAAGELATAARLAGALDALSATETIPVVALAAGDLEPVGLTVGWLRERGRLDFARRWPLLADWVDAWVAATEATPDLVAAGAELSATELEARLQAWLRSHLLATATT